MLFSGNYSEELWNKVNNARTVKKLRLALYAVTCKCQELETVVVSLEKHIFGLSERHKTVRKPVRPRKDNTVLCVACKSFDKNKMCAIPPFECINKSRWVKRTTSPVA